MTTTLDETCESLRPVTREEMIRMIETDRRQASERRTEARQVAQERRAGQRRAATATDP